MENPVCVSGGFQITPDGSFLDVEQTDLIVIPPFLPNVELLRENAKDMLDWIMARYEQGVSIAALCTGSFVLAETGLLDGRLATTNWIFARLFRRRYPKVLLKPERILTQDNGLICSGAVSAFYNLGLHIVETFGSSELASQCSKSLLVDSSRESQASYAIFNVYKGHGDDGILKAQQWMEAHLTENMSMENSCRTGGDQPPAFYPPVQESHRRISVELAAADAHRKLPRKSWKQGQTRLMKSPGPSVMKTAAPSANYLKNTPACHPGNTGTNLLGSRIRQEIERARTYRRDYLNRTGKKR